MRGRRDLAPRDTHALAAARSDEGGQLKYEIGWLLGATQANPTGTLRWRVELEIPF